MFAAAEELAGMAAAEGGKPIYSYLDERACSAGYVLASAADKVFGRREVTGGSIAALINVIDTSRAFEKAGLEPRRGGIPILLGTANGTVQAHVTTIDSLELGNIRASGTDAAVAESFGDFNVIGMNVLARLDEWRVKDGTLILVPKAEDAISE